MNINDYIATAIQRLHLDNQNRLAKELNVSSAFMANMKTGKKLPSEETILKLAELAGIEKEKALIDLNMWRAKDDADRLAVWQRISKMIGLYIIMSLSLFAKCGVVSHMLTMCNVYYVYLNKKIKCNYNKLAFVN